MNGKNIVKLTIGKYNDKKVVCHICEEEKAHNIISDDKLFELSNSLINQNMEAYQKLAK